MVNGQTGNSVKKTLFHQDAEADESDADQSQGGTGNGAEETPTLDESWVKVTHGNGKKPEEGRSGHSEEHLNGGDFNFEMDRKELQAETLACCHSFEDVLKEIPGAKATAVCLGSTQALVCISLEKLQTEISKKADASQVSSKLNALKIQVEGLK